MLFSKPRNLTISLLLISSTIACGNLSKYKILPTLDRMGEIKEYITYKGNCYSAIINTDYNGNIIPQYIAKVNSRICNATLLFSYSLADKILIDNYIKYLTKNYQKNYTQRLSEKLRKKHLKTLQRIGNVTVKSSDPKHIGRAYYKFYRLRLPKED